MFDDIEYDLPATKYRLKFSAFSGIGFTIEESEDMAELRSLAIERIIKYRNLGYDVNIIHLGKEWEFISPGNRDGTGLVSDTDGILHISVILSPSEL